MIIEEIYESIKIEKPRPRLNYRASDAGDCRRAIAYTMDGAKTDPVPKERQLIFEDGKLHHRDIQDRLLKIGSLKVTAVEDEFSKKFTYKGVTILIIGHPDAMANNKIVIEFKTMNHFTYKSVQKSQEPLQHHEDQLLLYMWLMDKQRGVIIMKNKNNSELLELPVRYDEKHVKELLVRFVEVEMAKRKKKLPARDYVMGSRECFRCNFFGACWGKEAKKQRIHMFADEATRVIDLDKSDEGFKQIQKAVLQFVEVKEFLVSEIKEMKGDGLRIGDYSLTVSGRKDPQLTLKKE